LKVSGTNQEYGVDADPKPKVEEGAKPAYERLQEAAEVARATKIAESTISEVLSGKRSLNRLHITRLAAYFHVKPEVFFRKARVVRSPAD
jgi:HTH-type transcriptional regulator/antitoxin HigA